MTSDKNHPDKELEAALEQCKNAAYGPAVEYLLRLQDSPRIQYLLGTVYEKGFSVPKDDAKAFEWYLKAAENHEADAQEKVAEFYRLGRGVNLDVKAAEHWEKELALQREKDKDKPPSLADRVRARL